ncbi:hypothetical protein [Robbsia andropogonis]|uniref:hypothetical protein n=1 Tax=Robbsia andropogonis TaxID=28092 RepID=UPI00209D1327|nr:hypothetical protein [Robbsia andropogonis]MCP1118920.1 hypothetical protein [Robbsia andropogonis]MCP1128728.1 hypothetical protein [Robbsia andropogonis]
MIKLTKVNVSGGLPAISTENIENVSESLAEKIDKVTNACFYTISSKISEIRSSAINNLAELKISLTPDEVVLAGEYKISKSNSKPLSYLLSFGAENGVIVSVVCSKTNNIGIYHIDDMNFLDRNLKKFIKKFGDIKNSDNWKVTMVGGQWLTGSGLSSKVKAILQNEYNITPEWNKWSWSGCSAAMYGVLLNVQTTEQKTFQHTRQFSDSVNKDILQQLRKRSDVQSDLLHAKNDQVTLFDSHEFSMEKNRSIIEEHGFNDVVYHVTASGIRARDHIDGFVRELSNFQGEMFLSSRKEQIVKINEIYQKRNLQDVVGLHIEKNRRHYSEDGSSFSTRSTDISRQRNSNSSLRHALYQSSHESRSTGISEGKEGAKQFIVSNSIIFTNQKVNFTNQQHKLAEKAISELENGRQHKSSHPMVNTRFSSSVLAKLKQEFPKVALDRLYSRDLGDWEGTGKGRGPWRVVSARCADDKLIIVGVFDNHKNPYQQW